MNKYKIGECSVCTDTKLIVNKTKQLCAKCNRLRLDEQRQTLKEKKPLNKISSHQQKELQKYEHVKARKKADQIEGGFYNCFFCGIPLKENENVDVHHSLGRIGPLLTDYRNIFYAHRLCHNNYHDMTIAQLLKDTNWYKPFLKRIMKINKKVYQQELKRLYKAKIIDLTMLLDEY